MRILFDQGTPVPLRRFLTDHDVATAYEQGWSSVTNGDLIRLAELNGQQALAESLYLQALREDARAVDRLYQALAVWEPCRPAA